MSLLEELPEEQREQRANAEYNAALEAKYLRNWEASLLGNERAQEIRPGDEATLWNLAIAATALGKWDRARFAWRELGIEVLDDEGEVHTRTSMACVRLDPDGVGEVVWGTRLDPARMQIDNVPLPTSGRRYGDIVLNDGAPEGTRTAFGREYPVFNELGLWQRSSYSTFEAAVVIPGTAAFESLEELCKQQDVAVENWATIRILCAACSRGNPGEHACAQDGDQERRIGFATKSEAALRQTLQTWG